MKCYYHSDIDAVATCKACSRGLCHDCSVDVPPGTACKDRCEAEVNAVNTVIERSKSAYQKTGGAYKRNGIVMLVMGSLFCLVGILPMIMHGETSALFLVIMGILFLVWSFFSFQSAKQITSIEGAE